MWGKNAIGKKNEISINQVTFFHGNSEMAKMIYKNTTHALLYCRTIQQNSINISKLSTNNDGYMNKLKKKDIIILSLK